MAISAEWLAFAVGMPDEIAERAVLLQPGEDGDWTERGAVWHAERNRLSLIVTKAVQWRITVAVDTAAGKEGTDHGRIN